MQTDSDSKVTDYVPYWIANSLSVIGCLWIFYLAGRLRGTMTYTLSLLILLSACDFTVSCIALVSPLIGVNDHNCKMIGPIKAFAAWASLSLCSAISRLIHLHLGEASKTYIKYHFWLILTCCVVSSLVVATL